MSKRIVVTGANGALGQALLELALASPGAQPELVAAVRSESAAAALEPLARRGVRVVRIAYSSAESLRAACEGAGTLVHLPGILIERRDARYESAHVGTTEVAIQAARAAGVAKLVLASAVGADPRDRNRYFRTKGEAEERVRASGLGYSILRAPLLLGPRTEGARALRRETARRHVWLLGGGRTWHQPLDVRDLAAATLCCAAPECAPGATLDLAGPEALRYRELVQRAARLRGREVRVHAVPVTPVRLALALRTRLFGPGLSPEALEVMLRDTRVDPREALEQLGLRLTPLDDTLRLSLEGAA